MPDDGFFINKLCVQPVFLFYRHREMFDSSLAHPQFLYSFLHNILDVFSQ